jgi:type IV pilus assembly protein PilC
MAETFTYKVRDRAGKTVEGQLEADNAQLVVSKLRSMGYVPIEIEQQSGKALSKEIKIPGFSDRVKLKDVAVFSPSRPRTRRSPRWRTRFASTSSVAHRSRPR